MDKSPVRSTNEVTFSLSLEHQYENGIVRSKILSSIKNVIIECITVLSFQRYHFHFGALTEKENVILFVDWTRLLSISIYEIMHHYH